MLVLDTQVTGLFVQATATTISQTKNGMVQMFHPAITPNAFLSVINVQRASYNCSLRRSINSIAAFVSVPLGRWRLHSWYYVHCKRLPTILCYLGDIAHGHPRRVKEDPNLNGVERCHSNGLSGSIY